MRMSRKKSSAYTVKLRAPRGHVRSLLNGRVWHKVHLSSTKMAQTHTSNPPQIAYCQGYSVDVDTIREQEYPLLNGTTFLPPMD